MTESKMFLQEYNPYNENLTVKLSDGYHSKVVRIGDIPISEELTLKEVLYVFNLDCNLLSVSKHAQDHNHIARFFSNLCEF